MDIFYCGRIGFINSLKENYHHIESSYPRVGAVLGTFMKDGEVLWAMEIGIVLRQ